MMKTMKTLFDDYALAAMQGLLAAQDKNNIDLLIANEIYRDRLASLAFSMADIMVERRNDMQEADVI
jgi:hypothetical protein